MESPDGVQLNIDKIASIFPQAVTETLVDGKPKKVVDFDKLRQLLSSDVLEGDEAYEFTWVGKRAAIAEANRPIRKTLRPCPDESKDWDTTQNLYIEGDNLEVLKLLQENYMGKVNMIYIDPPYNTGGDFIYRDDFVLSNEEYDDDCGAIDDDGNRLFKNTNTNGRFHSDWCSMMYSRIMLARDLLMPDGLLFVSIDEREFVNLKHIIIEIFGESNFIGEIIWKNKFGSGAKTAGIIGVHEYILVACKGMLIDITRPLSKEEQATYNKTKDEKFLERGGYITQPLAVTTFDDRPSLVYPIEYKGQQIWPHKQWVWSKERMLKAIENNEVVFNLQKDGSYNLRSKKYLVDENGDIRRGKPTTFYNDVYTQNGTKDIRSLFDDNVIFDYSKPVDLIKHLISIANGKRPNKHALILDFFSGSASTAHALFKQNAEDGGHRQFIMVQLPETVTTNSPAAKYNLKTICDIGKERIRRAGEAIKQEAGLAGQTLDIGFRVFKVDESNMEDIYYTPGETTQEKLREQKENIKGDRSALDLFFGCILDWGLPLSLPYTSEEIEGCTVHTYNDGDLVACFNEKIPESVVEAIAKRKPIRAVFRDSGFADSPAKINVGERFKLISPDTTVKVI